MDCPKCNNEMILGYIQSTSIILWSTQRRKLMVFADSDNDVLVGDGDLLVVSKESFRCPHCGTIIIPDTINTISEGGI